VAPAGHLCAGVRRIGPGSLSRDPEAVTEKP
jgi:hypothetical protein